MTTHSSIPAWEIHGQRSLVGYSAWGCKRAGHDLATKQQVTRMQAHRIPGVTGKSRSPSQCAEKDEKNWKEEEIVGLHSISEFLKPFLARLRIAWRAGKTQVAGPHLQGF